MKEGKQMTTSNGEALHRFAKDWSGRRMMVIHRSTSTPSEIPTADGLTISSPAGSLVVDEDCSVDAIDEALSAKGAVLKAGGESMQLQGDLSIDRVGEQALVIRVRHRRDNDAASGAVARMVLCVLSEDLS